ncbi:hypothetical protein [Halorhodospira sp. 9622]|uniref:hypothetical protein n=1 Tax=Halorhodospira sp. 9622 TaxID=2899136 RepID=UPI001EE82AA5|nr:hypothetical protein [Halorhodospira sp. 9622]MCG5538941.1 hypothetical protein [Halorhodospira sp. 9622]
MSERPTIPEAPDPLPQRTQSPDTFQDRADKTVRWWRDASEKLNQLGAWLAGRADETEQARADTYAARDTAQTHRDDAQAARDTARDHRDDAETYRDSAESIAAAMQDDAGMPSLEARAGYALVVEEDEKAVGWRFYLKAVEQLYGSLPALGHVLELQGEDDASQLTDWLADQGNEDNLQAWAESPQGMRVVEPHRRMMGAIAHSDAAMHVVAGAEEAMNVLLLREDVGLDVIKNSDTAMDAVKAEPVGIGKYALYRANRDRYDASDHPATHGHDFRHYADISDVAEDAGAMDWVATSSPAMEVVVESDPAMTTIAGSETAMGVVSGSSTAMSAIVDSELAMNRIAADSVARDAIGTDSTGYDYIVDNDMAAGKYAVGHAGLDPVDYADSAEVAKSETAMGAAVDDSSAMSTLADNSTAYNTFVDKQAVMELITDSQTAMDEIVERDDVMGSVVESSTAMNEVAAQGTARTTIRDNPDAEQAVIDNDRAISKFVAGEAGKDPQDYEEPADLGSSLAIAEQIWEDSTWKEAFLPGRGEALLGVAKDEITFDDWLSDSDFHSAVGSSESFVKALGDQAEPSVIRKMLSTDGRIERIANNDDGDGPFTKGMNESSVNISAVFNDPDYDYRVSASSNDSVTEEEEIEGPAIVYLIDMSLQSRDHSVSAELEGGFRFSDSASNKLLGTVPSGEKRTLTMSHNAGLYGTGGVEVAVIKEASRILD